MAVTIQIRRDTNANWTSNNPTLESGEFGLVTDQNKIKIGDGSTAWSSLPYIVPQSIDTTDSPTFDNLILNGNLTVNGTTTTVNSTTVSVDDKNIELGSVSSPTNTTADGGGITLKGTTDKTFNWVNSTGSWTSSENLELASGKVFRINGNEILSQTALGSTVISSSLTSVGTITTGTWSATNIALDKGGTNASLSAVNGGVVYSTASAMAITSAGVAGQILTSNGASPPTWQPAPETGFNGFLLAGM